MPSRVLVLADWPSTAIVVTRVSPIINADAVAAVTTDAATHTWTSTPGMSSGR